MLRQRILTALILIPIVVLAVLKLPTLYFALVLALIIALGAWEWAALSGFKTDISRVSFVLLVLLLSFGIYLYCDDNCKDIFVYIGLIWWMLAFICVIAHQLEMFSITRQPLLRAIIGLLVIIPAWLSLVMLHAHPAQGAFFVLLLFVLIWVADSAAYFAGRRWGKHRLASRVSPGKSWEGVLAGFIAAALLGAAYAWWQGMAMVPIVLFSILSLVTVACSVMGDLFESLIKRTANLKDSGNLLPGHGGVMDRIDSLTVAAPVFLVGLCLLGGFS